MFVQLTLVQLCFVQLQLLVTLFLSVVQLQVMFLGFVQGTLFVLLVFVFVLLVFVLVFVALVCEALALELFCGGGAVDGNECPGLAEAAVEDSQVPFVVLVVFAVCLLTDDHGIIFFVVGMYLAALALFSRIDFKSPTLMLALGSLASTGLLTTMISLSEHMPVELLTSA